MKEERTVTQAQVLALCPAVKKHLDNAVALLNTGDRHYDGEAMALCLGMAVTALSCGLGWHGSDFSETTGISRDSIIRALVPARCKVGASETLAREYYMYVDPAKIWRMLATTLIAVQQILASSTFKDQTFVFNTFSSLESTDVC